MCINKYHDDMEIVQSNEMEIEEQNDVQTNINIQNFSPHQNFNRTDLTTDLFGVTGSTMGSLLQTSPTISVNLLTQTQIHNIPFQINAQKNKYNFKRQGFTYTTQRKIPTGGGGRHRRHILSVDVIVESFKKVNFDDDNDKKTFIEWVGGKSSKTYNITDAGIIKAGNDMIGILENHPNNLIVDSGKENSALGNLGSKIKKALEKEELKDFIESIPNDTSITFSKFFKKKICNSKKGSSVDKMVKFLNKCYTNGVTNQSCGDVFFSLKEMYFNTQVDLMTTKSDNNLFSDFHNEMFYSEFDEVRTVNQLMQVCERFLAWK